jgi:hypothetical protein
MFGDKHRSGGSLFGRKSFHWPSMPAAFGQSREWRNSFD